MVHIYVRVRTVGIWDGQWLLQNEQTSLLPSGHDASTADATPDITRWGEQGDARKWNSATIGGPHRELHQKWPNTWFNEHPSIAYSQPLQLRASFAFPKPMRSVNAHKHWGHKF